MSALTHKFGLEVDLMSPESRHPDNKNGIEDKLRRKNGVIYAEFSKEHPDIVVIEFDPLITTPDEIYKKIRRLNGEIKRKVFM
jgi:predicted glycosyltransferase